NLIDIPRLRSLHLILSDTIELVNSFFGIQMVIIYTMYVYRLVMNAIVYQILGLYQTRTDLTWNYQSFVHNFWKCYLFFRMIYFTWICSGTSGE
ncbi:hypothetical protein J6590_076785, partial [Homalodisca vitripennis]